MNAETQEVAVSDDTTIPVGNVEDDFMYVRLPGGQVRAVPRNQIQDIEELPATAKQDANESAKVEEAPEHFYVHLANGSVERVAKEDLPVASGTNAPFGHWVRDGHAHHVVGIYPVETRVGK